MFGRAPDCLGPFSLPSTGAKHAGLGVAEVLASGLGGFGLLVTTPQGRPPHGAERQVGFHSPSSPEEDPPKTNSVEKGYDPDCKTYVSVIILRNEAGYIYRKYFCLLTARWRAGPLAGTVR